MGFEPMIRVLQTLALASWPRRLADWILSDSDSSVKRIKLDNRSQDVNCVGEWSAA